MGLVESFGRMRSHGKKQCRRLLRRIKAAIKKAVSKGRKQQFKFQYDPHSYALNFDDGCHQEIGMRDTDFHQEKIENCPEMTIWVYVLWVE